MERQSCQELFTRSFRCVVFLVRTSFLSWRQFLCTNLLFVRMVLFDHTFTNNCSLITLAVSHKLSHSTDAVLFTPRKQVEVDAITIGNVN